MGGFQTNRMSMQDLDPVAMQMAAQNPFQMAPPPAIASAHDSGMVQHPLHAVIAPIGPPKPMDMSPLDQQEGPQEKKLMADYAKDADPWGSADNHPGILGKIGHGLSVFAQRAQHEHGEMTPREAEEAGLEKNIQGIEAAKSKQGLEGAQAGNQTAEAGKATEETQEMPGKTHSEEGLQGAQAGEAEARANQITNPPEEWKAIPTVTGPNGEPVEIESKSGNIRFGNVSGTQPTKEPKPDSPEQQYIDEYQRTHKGGTVAQAERAYALDTQRPPQAPVTNILIPNGKGGYTVQSATTGSTIAPGAVTPAGMNTMNTPTAQTRNMAEMAQSVLPMTNSVSQEVQQLARSIGPAVGRWNQLMTNKGGTEFPHFAGLDTDLDLLSSAIVRTHFGARGGQQYREELRKMLGEAQTPDDLLARISHADGWLEGYAHMADRNGATGDGNVAPSRPANVPEGYTFNAKGSKGAGWYAPTSK